ncbi:MAG TPA: hypothetical protein VL282_03815 [Tepidisphaeraceae bacterium]|jgi:antitoxin component HigA of HigAB toxin-antitoxin module|nr:hypothetical protein [Tepidisphaeraceae bacterium]
MDIKASNRARKTGDDYLRLVRAHPLKKIRSKAELAAAIAALEPLALRGDLSQGEEDYREALAVFVHAYESEQSSLGREKKTPLERLKFLVDESGMSVNDLGKVLGSQPAASLVLSGKRDLSKANIRALADHFKLNPGHFI